MKNNIQIFDSFEELFSFLKENQETIEYGEIDQLAEFMLSAFLSPATDEQNILYQLNIWFQERTNKSMREIIPDYLEILRAYTLSSYKIKVLLGLRGPYDDDTFLDYVKNNPYSEIVEEVVKYQAVNPEAKIFMAEYHSDTSYLPEELKTLFVF